ncbi:MAG: class I tRNA ligase family protein [Oscillospiraceae bacterium]|nr:class I tRNA ligase family protein [Oscillospiraceae bacterium]
MSGGIIPVYNTCESKVNKDLENTSAEQIKSFQENMDNLYISNALSNIWNIITRTNKYIDETTPWALDKEGKKEELDSVMYHLAESLREVAIMLTPFIPDTAENIFNQLGIKDAQLKSIESLQSYAIIPENVKVIEKGVPLFLRLDVQEEVEYIKSKMSQ